MTKLIAAAKEAAAAGKLLPESAKNIALLLGSDPDETDEKSVEELLGGERWAELDNRFFRTLAFGTGGLRGKSVGALVTAPERGNAAEGARPQHPCVGTNAMNAFNVARATRGLVAYVREWHEASGRTGRPSICIAHDSRYFSREFAELAAKVICDLGCDARLFVGPRSTPELSFAVRHTDAAAGINITASHNPPEYNGYKVYFADGGQIVEPHASAIIARVAASAGAPREVLPMDRRGKILPMGEEVDGPYLKRLESLVLDRNLLRANRPRVVYSALHGVGGASIPPALTRLGVRVSTVASQALPDGGFPTVKSPNPENPDALERAVTQAESEGADLVIASDPDADRLGAAARDASGKFAPLTGNQIGSLLAWYRAKKFFDLGIVDHTNRSRAVIIKTFVTTDLQKAIADTFGFRCVETLTGFKYIGAKLQKYEAQIPAGLRGGYRRMTEEQTRRLRLEHASLFVFGGEESYGYSGADFVRDKDANSAAVMLAETAAFAASQGLTLHGLLDRIFMQYGLYLEQGESLVFDGAEGAAQIAALVDSYKSTPPEAVAGRRVVSVTDFSAGGLRDSEGDPIPREAMLLFELEGGYRVAVRPSGTEPKIKYYLFARADAPADIAELPVIRAETSRALARLWQELKDGVTARLAAA